MMIIINKKCKECGSKLAVEHYTEAHIWAKSRLLCTNTTCGFKKETPSKSYEDYRKSQRRGEDLNTPRWGDIPSASN